MNFSSASFYFSPKLKALSCDTRRAACLRSFLLSPFFFHSFTSATSVLPSFHPNFLMSLSFLNFSSFLEASFNPSLWLSYCHSSFLLSVFQPLHPTILPSALVLLTQAFFFHCPFSPCVPLHLSMLLSFLVLILFFTSFFQPFLTSFFVLFCTVFPSTFFNVTLSLLIVILLTLSVSKVRGKSSTNRKTFHTESNLRHFWNTSGSSTVSTQTQAQRDLNQQPMCVHSCASADQVADKASASSD